MPKPTARDVHIDRPLTNISIAFVQQAQDFVADRVFPNVPVQKQSDAFFLYDRGDFWRLEMQQRAPSTESAGGGWALTTDTYFCTPFALHKDIDDQIRANEDDPLNMDRDAVIYLTQQALLKRDKAWGDKYFKTGVWGADRVGGTDFTAWSSSGSTPVKDLRKEIGTVKKSTGYKPNKLVLGYDVWNILADHADLLDRIKYTEKAVVGPDLLASVLGIDEVVVAASVENTAAENATNSFSFIHGKQALLVYAAPRPSLMWPSGGYTFSWTGYLGGAGPQGQVVKTFRIDPIRSDRVELEMAFDQKLISSALGIFFDAAVA